ncbi:MAG: hypothetical protein NT015_03095 [Alphaproteobacteria bacterium]|nr:hypothetical protein [Alphaproteobacteria bacterium]
MRISKAAIMVALSALALAACDRLPGASAPTTEASPATTEAAATTTTEAYVGTWAVNAAGCGVPQELQGAPYIFNSDGFDQHEAHCTWANVQNTGPNAWRVDAACQVEGDEQSSSWDISVNGDTMQMNPGGSLVRCPN